MNKEEFLKKMREENEYDDPYEKETSSFSWKIGAMVALVLGIALVYLELIFFGNYNFPLFTAIVSMLAVKYIIKAIRIRRTSYIVFSVIFSIVFIALLVIYIIAFLNGWL